MGLAGTARYGQVTVQAVRFPLLTGLFLALVLRAAIPAGWMPATSGAGFSLALCSSQGARSILFDPGIPADDSATDSCPFALVALPADLGCAPLALPIALPLRLDALPLAHFVLRLTWARPPPTAPPVTLSTD